MHNSTQELDANYPYSGPNLANSKNGYSTNDSPWVRGNLIATELSDSISAMGYTLYKAPGNSDWVPLKSADWEWKGRALKSGQTWTASGAPSAGQTADQLEHPIWSAVISGVGEQS
jgi:hypothetical protein